MQITGTDAPGAAWAESRGVVGTVNRAHQSGQSEEVLQADFEAVVLELVAIAPSLIPYELDARPRGHGIQDKLERRQVVCVVAARQVAPVEQPNRGSGN